MLISKKKNKKIVLIICPHPDDGEAFSSQLCVQSIKNGWKVHQVLATCDEYGTPNKILKGERIKRIRKSEMIKAQKAYGFDSLGNPQVTLHWMHYIDGFVPHNKAAILRLQKFILKLNPDIVIGPDPFVYCDGHVDHMAVGKNYFFALKWMDAQERPKRMLYFQTLMPNYFLQRLYDQIVFKTRMSHASQWSPWMLKIIDLFNPLTQISFQLKFGHLKLIEGYREVTFTQTHNPPKGIARIFYYLFHDRPLGCEEGRFIPGPKELGLNLYPESEIE
ncbi:hypothetical protein NEF87_005042 [Candidatus Lokiarchaeum ossiferum]|uniref:PIG-L family deacetylase n=1 Tax=Candidatus Lokiarchaeum ossiferum TaxID=2951803 RepID=A0ABY6I2I3_9ARCH|nr:hypothetical protein NEF87_005042 [Candidatus Lokiarchaeum sp. B-35]